ncbi:hypothetical protein MHBO_002073 [Bonamia ostreae]|uniref:Ornithine decarboxylase n=2 Tax=Bonamia ostreae TaxID=126728 RepID=A0ABV2ALT9_9EUKA
MISCPINAVYNFESGDSNLPITKLADFKFDQNSFYNCILDPKILILKKRMNKIKLAKEIIFKNKIDCGLSFLDFRLLFQNISNWSKKYPNLTPFYSLRCLKDPLLLRLLHHLKIGFFCYNLNDLELLEILDISYKTTIMANPWLNYNQILVSLSKGIRYFLVDSEFYLNCIFKALKYFKIKNGVHIGVIMDDMKTINKMAFNAKTANKMADSHNLRVITFDINSNFDKIDNCTFFSNENCNSNISKFILRPILFKVVKIISIRKDVTKKTIKFNYFVDDSVYQNFFHLKTHLNSNPLPFSLKRDFKINEKNYISTIWGRTCDDLDCFYKYIYLPEMSVGDWFLFKFFFDF